jgi:SAM-dependent methyltransferase
MGAVAKSAKLPVKKLQVITKTKKQKNEVWLNLGSGVGLIKDFINVDMLPEKAIREGYETKKGVLGGAIIQPGSEYIQAYLHKLPFQDNYADYAIMLEVIEHQPIHLVIPCMTEIYRVMKPGSLLVISCPDFNGTAKWWLDTVGSKVGEFTDWELYKYIAEVIYGNQCHDGEFHRCPMTPDFVNFVLREAGWKNVKVSMWPRGYPPGKQYPGMLYNPRTSTMRTDCIIAEARK